MTLSPFRYEQNGHQPPGEAVCHQWRRNDPQRAWGEDRVCSTHISDFKKRIYNRVPWTSSRFIGAAPSSQNDCDGIPHARAGSWRWYKLRPGVCRSSAGAGRGAAQDGSVCVRGKPMVSLIIIFSCWSNLKYYNPIQNIDYFQTNQSLHLLSVLFPLFPQQVIEGYEMACKKALDILPDCVCSSANNLHDIKEATSLIRTAVISKQYGNEDFLANLIAQACGESAIWTWQSQTRAVKDDLLDCTIYFIFLWLSLLVYATVSIFPESGNFNVDSVRVCKILVSNIIHWIFFVCVCVVVGF